MTNHRIICHVKKFMGKFPSFLTPTDLNWLTQGSEPRPAMDQTGGLNEVTKGSPSRHFKRQDKDRLVFWGPFYRLLFEYFVFRSRPCLRQFFGGFSRGTKANVQPADNNFNDEESLVFRPSQSLRALNMCYL